MAQMALRLSLVVIALLGVSGAITPASAFRDCSLAYNNYELANGSCARCPLTHYPNLNIVTGGCVPYTPLAAKVSADFGMAVDTGSTAWMLASSALVFFMSPGVALFYGTLSTGGNVLNTLMLSLASVSIVTVLWMSIGYSLAFSPGNSGWGNGAFAGFRGVSHLPSGAYGPVPHVVFATYHCMMAQITPALISGAMVGRMRFFSYCVFVGAWSLLVYCPVARWCWSRTVHPVTGEPVAMGWLAELGFVDFAGGTVVHISSGFSALAAIWMVGERLVRKDKTKIDGPLLLVGVALLWFGWLGFNGGSADSAKGVAATALFNTHMSACMCMLVWMTLEYFHHGKQTFVGACAAIVIGLVAITPASGYVTPAHALGIGGIAALLAYGVNELKLRYLSDYLDDSLDVFLCHGASGFIGTVLTGFFADGDTNAVRGAFQGNGYQLGIQLAGAMTGAAYSFTMSCCILLVIKHTIGLRVDEDVEIKGLDHCHTRGTAEVRDHTRAPTDEDQPFAIVIIDIDRSSVLWSQLPAAMGRAVDVYMKCVRAVVEQHAAYIGSVDGEKFMVAFAHPSRAVRFAVDVQSALHRQPWNTRVFDEFYSRQIIKALRARKAAQAVRAAAASNACSQRSRDSAGSGGKGGNSKGNNNNNTSKPGDTGKSELRLADCFDARPTAPAVEDDDRGSAGSAMRSQDMMGRTPRHSPRGENFRLPAAAQPPAPPSTPTSPQTAGAPPAPAPHAATAAPAPAPTTATAAGGVGNNDDSNLTSSVAAASETEDEAALIAVPSSDVWGGLRARVGVHFGSGGVRWNNDAQGYEYDGSVVAAAKRIEALGNGGQVLVSMQTWQAAKESQPNESYFSDVMHVNLGHVPLRGFRGETEIMQLTPVHLAARRYPTLRETDTTCSGSDAGSYSEVSQSRSSKHVPVYDERMDPTLMRGADDESTVGPSVSQRGSVVGFGADADDFDAPQPNRRLDPAALRQIPVVQSPYAALPGTVRD